MKVRKMDVNTRKFKQQGDPEQSTHQAIAENWFLANPTIKR